MKCNYCPRSLCNIKAYEYELLLLNKWNESVHLNILLNSLSKLAICSYKCFILFFPKYERCRFVNYHGLLWPLIKSIKVSLKLLEAPTSLTSSCKSWFHTRHSFAWFTWPGLQTHCLLSFPVAANAGDRAWHWQQMWRGPEKINCSTTMLSAEAKYWLSDL